MIIITITITIVGFQSCGSFAPHWGPEDPSGVHLRLCVCVSVSLSLCLYVCRLVRIDFWQTFARPVIARSACGRRPQVPQYNLYQIMRPVILRSACSRTPQGQIP